MIDSVRPSGAWPGQMSRITARAASLLRALASGVLLSACADHQARDATDFTRADSAGFTIVTNTAGASSLTTVLTGASEPRVRIGVEEGAEELQFSRINGAVRLDDGRIAVANGQPMELRVFTPTGKFIKRLGRTGQGPGEFQYVKRMMATRGDTVLVVNMPQFQLLTFTAGNGYVGSSSTSFDSLNAQLQGMRLAEGTAELLRNGSMVVGAVPKDEPENDGSLFPTGKLFRRQTMAVWIDRDHSRFAVLGTFGDIQQMFFDVGGGRRTPVIPPSARFRREAIGGRGTRFCIAGNDAPEVRCVDEDGRRLIIRWTQDSVPTPVAAIDEWRNDVRTGAARPGSRTTPQAAERIIAGTIIPATAPPIRSLFVDADRRVFVGGPDLGAAEGRFRYRVFSADGQLLGLAELPRVGVTEIGTDYLVGISRNEDGVEFIVVHDLTGPRKD
jgi:hypothetical protein